jgi:hypothetical protein
MPTSYTPLEGNNLTSLGVTAPSFGGVSTSFYATSTFVYTLFFVAIVGAAFYQYVLAGIYRMEASQDTIRKSNETIKRVILGVFSLFLILFTVNKGMLRGDVGFSSLYTGTSGQRVSQSTQTQTVTQSAGSGGSPSCESDTSVKQKLASSGGLCGGTQCTVLSGCDYATYLPTIRSLSQTHGVDAKIVVAIMCKESRAKKDAIHKNENGTYDCGLMQINSTQTCSPSLLDPVENITRGVIKLKDTIARSTSYPSVPGVPAIGNAFASYNCCANGTVPAAPSVDCTQASGFQNTLPKWACPINPGTGAFNMCSVKNYACEITSCLDQINI